MLVHHYQHHQPGVTDCPEFAPSVSTSGTGSHAHEGVVTLRVPPSAISSFVLLLVLISQIPQNELGEPRNTSKLITIQSQCLRMHQILLQIKYDFF